MPTEYYLPTFLTEHDYYPGMCRVIDDVVVGEPPEELETAMNALLNMSNKQPNTEAKIVEDLWGDFKRPDTIEEECKQASDSPQ